MGSAIQVLSSTPQECVIYSPPLLLGIYAGIAWQIIFLAMGIAYFLIPKFKAKVNVWPMILLYVLFAWLMPLRLSGSSQRAIFSRANGTVTISERFMLVPKKPVVVPLGEVSEATVGGRYSWLLLNMKDGGQLSLGPDSSLGGRENARDAINAWLENYRSGAGA